VNLLSPEVVVVGGGVTGALGESFIERIWDFAQRSTLPGSTDRVRCVPAALGDDSGIVGCAAFAKAKLKSNSTTLDHTNNHVPAAGAVPA
jgi:glucokinase